MEKRPPSPDVFSQIREVLGLGADEAASLAALQRYTRRQLLECAQRLGLTGLQRLTKDAIAERFQTAWKTFAASLGVSTARGTAAPADLPRKFDLGLPAEKAAAPQHIPWGYAQDRVTAMVVDPDRLYVYWEVTDEAIEHARGQLGPAGREAWLNLRVYDVTGRIFDGTNAHAYFDHKVERGDRQWFFDVGKPSSTACVELGLKSIEGYFVRIVRSGRAEFPRREPAPATDVEWLTVYTATGEVGAPVAGGPGAAVAPAAPPWPTAESAPRAWDIRQTHARTNGEPVGDARLHVSDWHEVLRGEWVEGGRVFTWEGPVVRTRWEAGPFTVPVESPSYVEERDSGRVAVHYEHGRARIVYGPWQVVIRGLGAHAERRILGRWEIYRSWVADAGHVVRHAGAAAVAPGSSEALARGASELRWAAASEVRLGGASEIHRVGASELRFRGASETLYAGASEWRARGASEWRYVGASEWRYAGASESRLLGASERRLGGASERQGGASEALGSQYPRARAGAPEPSGSERDH